MKFYLKLDNKILFMPTYIFGVIKIQTSVRQKSLSIVIPLT